MGWTVLYIAFGVVALWLLGEVLLQYKARLRWRLLAFAGFLGVVVGVLVPSTVVIVVGAVVFAVGQTYVTLSFRRGFSTGWALGGSPGASRRRRSGKAADEKTGPTLEVTDLSYDEAYEEGYAEGYDQPTERADDQATPLYEPQPMPEDTGQYAVYGTSYEQQQPYADPYATGYDQQQPAYDYGTSYEQQQYAAYSDPYIGQQYGDAGAYQQQPYADPYAPSYTYDTPPGGVWVPQQRDTEQGQQYQDQQGYYGNNGDYQQYR
ncbi:hypothetical protein KV205_02245 [Streptomyces sp. SKN60]|uniref:hypothetical protein n=1 Tax=Streptomyces sp. SKN60 TaxID=2855506 RepID=UPI002245A075|nr:hypothetical protein [Streptomyces sp. SKN60]MCX2179353.1 hypothetical protein [Streptomyces sp. SKN60]